MDESTRDELDNLRIESQADLHRMWQLLIRPLGFSHGSLWVGFIDPDRRAVPYLVEIEDADTAPSDQEADNLFATFSTVTADAGAGSRLAFLISRPGAGPVGRSDARFAMALVEGARRNGVVIAPVHLAHDLAILPVTPDDLVA